MREQRPIPAVFDSDRFIPFTDDQLRSMADQYEAGKTTYQLSDIFGVDPRAICRRLRLLGVQLRNRGNTPIFSDSGCLEMIAYKKASGKTIKDLAEMHGCSAKTINDALLRGRNLMAKIG
jgi:hypothetical protein